MALMLSRRWFIGVFFLLGLACAVVGFLFWGSAELPAGSPKEAFEQLRSSWNERDLDGFLSLFHEGSRLKQTLAENPIANPWDLWEDEASATDHLFAAKVLSETGVGQATASLFLEIEIPGEVNPVQSKIQVLFARSNGRYLLIDVIP